MAAIGIRQKLNKILKILTIKPPNLRIALPQNNSALGMKNGNSIF
jgi:hypothetical protein